MVKEKGYNPVQAHHKAEKAKVVKKGKAEVQLKRNEKLARRNPDRIQKQIADLEKVASSGGTLGKHEEQTLEALKQDLRAVNKARGALGDKAPTFGRGDQRRGDGRAGGGGVLGKRRRDDQGGGDSTEDEDVPEDVRNIPMPRDTPPPIPKEGLDRWWAKRRARRNAQREVDEGITHRDSGGKPAGTGTGGPTSGAESGAAPRERRQREPAPAPQTVYSSQPVLRDLRKEAAVFMPASVRSRMVETGAASTSRSQAGLPNEQDEQGCVYDKGV